ncbi:MAG: endonuclease [Asgard group archaeon]|nr:endonuclease [Asgard group archaeon]
MAIKLEELYEILYNYYGPQGWWPGEGLEIAIGAILTQQTSWISVEKAIQNLKDANCLNIKCLETIHIEKLETLIKPSGYYRIKARRLKNFIELISKNPTPSREELLLVNGLGLETADSVLLYWFEEPYFVIDVYTYRILERLGINSDNDYLELQRIFIDNLPKDIEMYKEFHALLVQHAKSHCLKNHPKCDACPLNKHCSFHIRKAEIL